MYMEDLSTALVATIRDRTSNKELIWQFVQVDVRPAPGAVASPSQFEVMHQGTRFLLFEEEVHRYHVGMQVDVWLKRYVLSTLDAQGREVWRAADTAFSVSHLYRVVSRQVVGVEKLLASLTDPETYRLHSQIKPATFDDIDHQLADRSIRARLRNVWLGFLEYFYWQDILAARERMLHRAEKVRARA